MSDASFRLSPPERSNTHTPPKHRVIDPVALSPIDPQLAHTLSQRLAVSKVPGGEPVNSDRNLRLCAGIRQLR